MSYPQINRQHQEHTRSVVWTATAVVLLLLLFVVSVYQFRKPKEETQEEIVASIEDVFVPTKGPLIVPEEGLFPHSRQADLFMPITGDPLGHAYRGTKNSNYFIEFLSPLPEIDREKQFYEGWLIRPIPYDFFSVGEMVTNELGQFILAWEGERGKEYKGYTQVVITLEAYGGPEGPNAHVAEGEFRDD